MNLRPIAPIVKRQTSGVRVLHNGKVQFVPTKNQSTAVAKAKENAIEKIVPEKEHTLERFLSFMQQTSMPEALDARVRNDNQDARSRKKKPATRDVTIDLNRKPASIFLNLETARSGAVAVGIISDNGKFDAITVYICFRGNSTAIKSFSGNSNRLKHILELAKIKVNSLILSCGIPDNGTHNWKA